MRHVPSAACALCLGALCFLLASCSSEKAAAATSQASSEAAPSSGPVTAGVSRFLDRYSDIMVAAAEEMPEDSYGFSPTPEQMTFGHLVSHVAGSNNYLCANVSGLARPEAEEIAESAKGQLVAAMRASFDFCAKALARVDDAQLADQVQYFGGREVSKARVMLALVADWADHYGQEAMYLRLKGHLPPTAKREGGE